MSMITTEVQWHNVELHPYDLPSHHEKVLVTVCTLSGKRRVVPEAYIMYTDNDVAWCVDYFNCKTRSMESVYLWEPVIAWAYYPEPYYV